MRARRRFLSAILVLAGLLRTLPAGAAPVPQQDGAPLTVFAAASLSGALQRIGTLWQQTGHDAPRFSFASSGTLARQIAAGAPANLFISADEHWMDWLAQRGLTEPGSRSDLLGNTLVLVMPKASARPVALGPGLDVEALLGAKGRVAVGDPASVPAGLYARQALVALSLWDRLKDRLAPAADVRAALQLVSRGEAPAGIVYGSDVRVAPDLAVAATFPAASHPAIVYPVALVAGQATMTARDFAAFLSTAPATAVFRQAGFTAP
jgi:molybdate transport system substrate-binding protein